MNSTSAKVKSVRTVKNLLTVGLVDGRILSLPLAWYPSLQRAKPAVRARWEPCAAGRGIHWPDLDYDLSIEGLLRGAHETPGLAASAEGRR
jgi:hypothetical protein